MKHPGTARAQLVEQLAASPVRTRTRHTGSRAEFLSGRRGGASARSTPDRSGLQESKKNRSAARSSRSALRACTLALQRAQVGGCYI